MKYTFEGQIRDFIGYYQNLYGKFMNSVETFHFKKVEVKEISPLVEGSLSVGCFSFSGTAEYNIREKTLHFSGSGSGEICKTINDSLTIGAYIDFEGNYGLEGECSIPTPLQVVDIKINGGCQKNKDGTFEITLKVGAGIGVEDMAEADVYGGVKLQLSSVPWEYDTQNGSYGTAGNLKNESLNKNLSIYQDSISADCFMRYMNGD